LRDESWLGSATGVAGLRRLMIAAAAVVAALLGAWLALLAVFWRRLRADWREPVLSTPVLIVESDDWGPGPSDDAVSLQRLRSLLLGYRDGLGNPPVVTLGVLLAAPRAPEPNAEPVYVPCPLDDPSQASLLQAMRAGAGDGDGVFALQLHAHEHFWPPALQKAARHDPIARAFLRAEPGAARHESLPPALQARWVDAATLPSVALPAAAIEAAVAEEAAAFKRIFGVPARVAVPVTFIWTQQVEQAWARHGIRVVVTPGLRNIGRDAGGRLVSDGAILRNGDAAAGDMRYVVRDVYFEPAHGHTAAETLRQVRERHRLGRPALLEMHRFNFTADPAQAERSLAELGRLLEGAVATIPGLRFMSTESLADALRRRDPALVDARRAARIRAFVLRAATERRLRKLAWATGLAVAAAAALGVATLLLRQPQRARMADS
jgi:hypothetical protein